MKITQDDITGPMARDLRKQRGMTQAQFWNPVGVQQSVACRYESGADMPDAVRILLVATYVGGLTINTSSSDGVADLARLGSIQSNFKAASAIARKATRDLDSAAKDIGEARAALQSI